MRSASAAFALCCQAIILTASAHAQQSDGYPEGTVRVELVDGTTHLGVVGGETDSSIVLLTQSGLSMTIPVEQIVEITSVAGKQYYRMDPNRTRLLFAPTARAIGSGTGYIAVYEIFVPFAAVGAGNRVTLAGGLTINPGEGRLLYAVPKVTVFERNDVSVAVGGLGVAYLGDGSESVGMLFGVGTFGDPSGAVTAGFAFGYFDGRFGKNPALLLGGEYQVSNMIKLLTENYLFVGTEDGLLVSGGVRFFGDDLAADLGLFTIPALMDDLEGFPFFPWLGFAFNF